jgi:hypothetical protein
VLAVWHSERDGTVESFDLRKRVKDGAEAGKYESKTLVPGEGIVMPLRRVG